MKSLFLLLSLLSINAFATLPGSITNNEIKSVAEVESSAGVITGNLTLGSPCISSPSSTSNLPASLFAYDFTNPTYLPFPTTIVAIPGSCSAGQIQLSQNATHAATGDSIAFGGQPSDVPNDTKVWLTSTSPPQLLSTAILGNVFSGNGSQFNGINYLTNPSFEAGTTNWNTVNGTASSDTVNFTDGAKSIQISASAQTPELSQDATPTTELQGVPMQAICFVKTSLSNIQVCSRLAGVDGNCQAVPSTNQWSAVISTFTGPSSGSVGVSVKATGSDTGTYNVDQCYVGKNISIFAGNSSVVSSGTERINRAFIHWTGSAYTVSSQSGSWISSVTNPGPGRPYINIVSGIYSGVPSCSFLGEVTSGSTPVFFVDITNATPTAILMPLSQLDSVSQNSVDRDFYATCIGPQ